MDSKHCGKWAVCAMPRHCMVCQHSQAEWGKV